MNRSLFVFLMVAISWRSLQAKPVPKNPNPIPLPTANLKTLPVLPIVEALCNKSVNVQPCLDAVQADPRNEMKSTPEGIVMILVDAAKANIESATEFLKKAIPTVKERTAKNQMKDCLGAYGAMKPELNVDLKMLGTPEGKADAEQTITSVEMDLSYDCSWEEVKSHPPPLQEMIKRVNSFSAVLVAAAAILSDTPSE